MKVLWEVERGLTARGYQPDRRRGDGSHGLADDDEERDHEHRDSQQHQQQRRLAGAGEPDELLARRSAVLPFLAQLDGHAGGEGAGEQQVGGAGEIEVFGPLERSREC